jgi:hypothetical protein
MSKELYVYTDPQLPSELMEPGVAVGTATGFDAVVSDLSGIIIVQFPLWHLFTPQNVSPVPQLPATKQHQPYLPPHFRPLFCVPQLPSMLYSEGKPRQAPE